MAFLPKLSNRLILRKSQHNCANALSMEQSMDILPTGSVVLYLSLGLIE